MNVFIRPETAAQSAGAFDSLFLGLLVFSAFIVALVAGLLIVFAIRFRAGSPAARHRVPRMLRREIEIGWFAATAFFALFIFWFASTLASEQSDPPADAMEFHVEAKQWMWHTRGASGVREINALHVPVDQDVVLYLNSQDVIHSFYVPAFRIKQDVVPGRTTTLWFRATRPGAYRLLCAEYCGTDHARMTGEIVVMQPAAYARWLESQPADEGLAQKGRALFTAAGCAGCHASRSSVHAPRLEGLYGRNVPLSDGRRVRADEAYIRDSILLPRRDIVAGYEPLMPEFSNVLEPGDVSALVAYIRSLSDSTPPAEEIGR